MDCFQLNSSDSSFYDDIINITREVFAAVLYGILLAIASQIVASIYDHLDLSTLLTSGRNRKSINACSILPTILHIFSRPSRTVLTPYREGEKDPLKNKNTSANVPLGDSNDKSYKDLELYLEQFLNTENILDEMLDNSFT